MKFNLQLFSDTITSSQYLQFDFGFNDGDNRKQNIPSPRDNITESELTTFDSWLNTYKPVIGDKFGASTTGINSATIIEQTKVKLDLN